MMNPWAKSKQMKLNLEGQAPAQVDLNAAAAIGTSGFQLSSLPLDSSVVAPLGSDNTINSFLAKSGDTNAVAENSYPGLNIPSLDTTQGGNVVTPSDFAPEYGYWQKDKRSSRAWRQRRRRSLAG